MTCRATVRMYRQGLGDCLLLTLPKDGGDAFRVMIDCGVILGTRDPKEIMAAVVDDIAAEAGCREADGEVVQKGRIDLLLVTHAHWDHVSGFAQAGQRMKDKLEFGEVWMGWTEDPDDALARSLVEGRRAAVDGLRLSAARLRFGARDDEAAQVEGMLDFFGAAPRSTDEALDFARGLGPLRYVRPGDAPLRPPGVAARLYVLGPPRDEALIRKSHPSRRGDEVYNMHPYALALGEIGGVEDQTDDERPFSAEYEIPVEVARGRPFFRKHYWTGDPAQDWRLVDGAWMDGAVDLALKLDADTNNTSLVVAVELDDGNADEDGPDRDVLLFAADAQVGNWLSWGDVRWPEKGGDGPVTTGLDLLRRTVLYKVGHHGSHNATLKKLGLEQMERLEVALIPVDYDMAVKKGWSRIPLPALELALERAAKRGVVRSDRSGSPVVAREERLFQEVEL